MLTLLAVVATLGGQSPAPSIQDVDGPVVTANTITETAEALRVREAIAYAGPLPRGAPTQDYPLVAWCSALVKGHIALGESLTSADPLDREIMRLGALEAQDFDSALQVASARQSAQVRTAAGAASQEATAKWAPLMAQTEESVRSEAFGLFFGLPGRCEHAARRIRENISTPPTTLDQAGLDETGSPIAR